YDLVANLVTTHAERGAKLAAEMKLGPGVAEAIGSAAEHFDGSGAPKGLSGEDIPLAGRILALAQAVTQQYADSNPDGAMALARKHAGSWFDPEVVAAFEHPRVSGDLVESLRHDQVWHQLTQLEPLEQPFTVDDDRLDGIATVFGHVIDAKSPWTRRHSTRVRELVLGMLDQVDPSGDMAARRRALSRGASLHDV